jgi:two-component system, OmpR family, response regulator TctD
MRLLVAEDNEDLATWIARLLRQSKYAVDLVHRGDDADEALRQHRYALLVLDLALPGLDGIEVLKRLRRRGDDLPVLILTANDAVSARVQGLDAGADDYLVKPFEAEELEARIRAQLRRARTLVEPVLACGALKFQTHSREFTLAGQVLALTPRERAVLEVLVRRAGRNVSKGELAQSIFGLDNDADPSAVEIYVHRLRKKLENQDITIQTLRGLGYVLRNSDHGH